MRNAALATAAILTFGCAQGVPGEPPVDAEATTPQQPDAGPGDGGVAAGPCDPSIAASEGVAIVDTGACPGVIPAASTCAAEITICSGLGSGDTGNAVVGATSDGRGSVVLSCRRNDVGPPQLNFLFVAIRNGFVSKASLGVDVRPLRDGFIASEGSYLLPPPTYDFLAHDGGFRAAQSAALAGGAIAIAAEPQSGVATRSWRGIVAAGDTIERAAPGWLASRGDFFLLPQGRAMAFGTEILAADGSSCGTVNLGAPLVGIGVDGTAFTARSQRTFRIHPQLFR